MKYFNIVVEGGTEAYLDGPYLSSEASEREARAIFRRIGGNFGNVFWLNVSSTGDPAVGSYSSEDIEGSATGEQARDGDAREGSDLPLRARAARGPSSRLLRTREGEARGEEGASVNETDRTNLINLAQSSARDERHWSVVGSEDRAENAADLSRAVLAAFGVMEDHCTEGCKDCKAHEKNIA